MPTAVACPNPACARSLTVPETAIGRTARCRHCGQSFVLSQPSHATVLPESDRTQGGAPVPSAARTDTAHPAALGRFRILAELGSGAFGTVYRAYDPQLDREVALKVPHAALLADPRVVARFLREAKAAANLRHPNIVPVFESGQAAGGYYIASAFIDGKPLSDAIPDGGLPFSQAARLARELAAAVGYAHEQGIVHRDIKPANVMVDRAGRPHLMDFGLASRAEEGSKVTTDGAILGTPAYMSPEQARGQGGEAGPAADQYAVGVVLYELLTGRVPFAGPAAIVIHNVLHLDPDPPSKHRPGVPRDLETICRKAMAKRPEDRYPSCEALADDLRRWLDGEPVTARRLSGIERAALWVRREPAAAAAYGFGGLAAALILIGITVVGLWLNAKSERARAERSREVAESEKKAADDARTNAEAEKRNAERARALTEIEKQKVEAARQAAEVEQKKAEEARRREETARREAETNRDALAAAREKLARVDYWRAVELANIRSQSRDLMAAKELLRSAAPQYRGREWWYLTRHVDRDYLSIDSGTVRSVTLDPGGTRILAIGAGTTAYVWDVRSGQRRHSLRHSGEVRAASFSPDGTRIVTMTDKEARIWDAETGIALETLTPPAGQLHSASFSPDGAGILVTYSVWGVAVWDAHLGNMTAAYSGPKAQVRSASFSPKGDRVAAAVDQRSNVLDAALDRGVWIWDTKTGAILQTLKHDTGVASVAFNSDGTRVVTSAGGQLVWVWDVATGRCLHTFKHISRVVSATVSPDGTQLLTAEDRGEVCVWDAKSYELVRVLKHPNPVRSASYSPDGTRILTSGPGATRVWDSVTGTEYVTLDESEIPALFSPDGSRIVTAGRAQIRIYDGNPAPPGAVEWEVFPSTDRRPPEGTGK